jgi:flagellar hook-basal body complex protein FliE
MAIGPIDPSSVISPISLPSEGKLGTSPDGTQGVSFADVFKNVISSTNKDLVAAEEASKQFAAGAVDDIHGTMIAVKKADIELKLAATVRTKLVDAFNDLWRMSV